MKKTISMKKLYLLLQTGLLGTVLLLAMPQAQAAISVVQAVGASSGGGTTATATVSATTAGNLLVVAIWQNSNAKPSTSISDNAANAYFDVGDWARELTYFAGCQIYYAINIKAGATSVSVSGPSSVGICVYEISGADPNTPLTAKTVG